MTIMFCAFEGSPLILRAYGEATVLHVKDERWDDFVSLFPESVGARQIFILDVDLVQSSCGMSVPYFAYESDRDDLTKFSAKKGIEGMKKCWLRNNQKSIDGFESEIAKRAGLDAE